MILKYRKGGGAFSRHNATLFIAFSTMVLKAEIAIGDLSPRKIRKITARIFQFLPYFGTH
jgi:hypothetical protein